MIPCDTNPLIKLSPAETSGEIVNGFSLAGLKSIDLTEDAAALIFLSFLTANTNQCHH